MKSTVLEDVMALINCRECGKKVSDKAVTCPYCGIRLNDSEAMSIAKALTWMAIIFFIIMTILSFVK